MLLLLELVLTIQSDGFVEGRVVVGVVVDDADDHDDHYDYDDAAGDHDSEVDDGHLPLLPGFSSFSSSLEPLLFSCALRRGRGGMAAGKGRRENERTMSVRFSTQPTAAAAAAAEKDK